MYQTVRGLTIRSVDYKEADQILTVLTDTRGCLTVKARGVRRKGSRLKAAAQLFTLSQMTLYEQKGRIVLQEAEVLQQFPGLQADLTRLALASYLAEVLGTEAEDSPAETDIQRLALNSLYALSNGLCSHTVVKAAFELRYMLLAGYAPDLSACVVCGSLHPVGFSFCLLLDLQNLGVTLGTDDLHLGGSLSFHSLALSSSHGNIFLNLFIADI